MNYPGDKWMTLSAVIKESQWLPGRLYITDGGGEIVLRFTKICLVCVFVSVYFWVGVVIQLTGGITKIQGHYKVSQRYLVTIMTYRN